MTMSRQLYLPKFVQINNPRLLVFNYVMKMGLLVGFVLGFLYSQDWQLKKDLSDKIFTNIYVTTPPNFAQMYNDILGAAGICNPPTTSTGNIFDYSKDLLVPGKTSENQYLNCTCAPLCPEDRARRDCVNLPQLFSSLSPQEVFFNTHVSDKFYTSDSSTRSEMLFPMAADMQLNFHYGFVYESSAGESTYNLFTQKMKCLDPDKCQGTSTKSDDAELDELLKPSSTIMLTVRELIELSGLPEAVLLQPNPRSGANYMVESRQYTTGPAVMISGMELIVDIHCTDRALYMEEYPILMAKNAPDDYQKPYLCYLWVRRFPQPWVEVAPAETVSMDGSTRYRKYHGIKVRVQSYGVFHAISVSGIMQWMVIFYVLMGLPTQIIGVITCNMLGRLSVIYNKACVEEFSLRDGIGSCCAHLVSNYVLYCEMKEGSFGVPKKYILARLSEVLNASKHKSELDDYELQCLTDFCFDTIAYGTEANLGRDMEVEEFVSMSQYDAAMTMNEKVHFQDVVNLFDLQRPRGMFEKIFTPSYLREATSKFVDMKPRGDDVYAEVHQEGRPQPVTKSRILRNLWKGSQFLAHHRAFRFGLTLEDRKEDIHDTQACVDVLLEKHSDTQDSLQELLSLQERKEQSAKDYASSLATKTLLTCMEECHQLRQEMEKMKARLERHHGHHDPHQDDHHDDPHRTQGNVSPPPNVAAAASASAALIGAASTENRSDYKKGFEDGTKTSTLLKGTARAEQDANGVLRQRQGNGEQSSLL